MGIYRDIAGYIKLNSVTFPAKKDISGYINRYSWLLKTLLLTTSASVSLFYINDKYYKYSISCFDA